MLQRKSKADKAAEAATTQAHRAREAATKAGERVASTVQQQASTLAQTVKEKAGPKAEGLAASAAELAAQARDRAVTSLDQGIDVAVPKVDAAVEKVAPKVDHARDVIVEDLLPKIHEMLLSVQASKDELLSRQDGAVAAVTGAPKKRKRKGRVLIALGLLSAASAGVAWYLDKQRSAPKSDPWATPSRPIGGSPGADTQVRATTGTGADTSTSLGAAGAGAGATSADTTAGEAAGTTDDGDSDTRILGTDEIDQLASDSQEDEQEVPGANTEDTTGLGTAPDTPEGERNADLGDLGGSPRP